MRKTILTTWIVLILATAVLAYEGSHSGQEIDDAIDLVKNRMSILGGNLSIYAPNIGVGGRMNFYAYDPAPYFNFYPGSDGGGIRLYDSNATYYSDFYTDTNGYFQFTSVKSPVFNLPANYDFAIVPGSAGFGFLMYDFGADSYIRAWVVENQETLRLDGSVYIEDDLTVLGNYTLPLTEDYVLKGNSSNQAEAVNALDVTVGGFTANKPIVSDANGDLTEAEPSCETYTIAEPDEMDGIEDEIVLKHYMTEHYPYGFTVMSFAFTASSSVTDDDHNLEHWDDRAGSTKTTIDDSAAFNNNQRVEDDGTLSSATIPADGYLVIDLDDSSDDVGTLEITVCGYAPTS